MPIFSTEFAILTLEENFPKGLDFSYLLKIDNESLSVFDKDLPSQTLTFDVSDERFEALPANRIDFFDDYGNPRIRYEPRIAVKLQLNSADSPIKFNLIAKVKTLYFNNLQMSDLPCFLLLSKDTENPSKENRFPITVNIDPQDARDPEFEEPYYTSIILDSTVAFILLFFC
jgi:hypothetical protein